MQEKQKPKKVRCHWHCTGNGSGTRTSGGGVRALWRGLLLVLLLQLINEWFWVKMAWKKNKKSDAKLRASETRERERGQ